ncbi:hypothetical protein D1007_43401 [Hordeum vulgare]|nr:hypothetical protein D1007_43401 [Hordeum vulgare]
MARMNYGSEDMARHQGGSQHREAPGPVSGSNRNKRLRAEAYRRKIFEQHDRGEPHPPPRGTATVALLNGHGGRSSDYMETCVTKYVALLDPPDKEELWASPRAPMLLRSKERLGVPPGAGPKGRGQGKRSLTPKSVAYSKPNRPSGGKKDGKEKKKTKGDDELKNAMEAIVNARKEANEVRKMARNQDAAADERRLATEERRVADEERKVTMKEKKLAMEERARLLEWEKYLFFIMDTSTLDEQ